VALGTRLGLQQTGFNWQAFVPNGVVVQVDVDAAELGKGHPRVDLALRADADDLLARILDGLQLDPAVGEWRAFARRVSELLPLSDPTNQHADGYFDPYDWTLELSALCTADDVVIPASSGGANSVSLQTFQQKLGQAIVTNHGLAAMGYGLSGAIGAALGHPGRRTVLIEGDGGFAQNLQELGTVAVNALPLKCFLMANEGYASIRSTQRNYFGGEYVGCDTKTGLGFPDWEVLFGAFGIPAIELRSGWTEDARFRELWESNAPAGFVVPIDPEQSYLPKISSRVTSSGSMESNPLHRMSPDLPDELAAEVLRYLP
jgi:acetolactate synthase-1/2/3 large subunit